MSALHPGITGKKAGSPKSYDIPLQQMAQPPPLLVSVVEARRILGNMSRGKFWAEAKLGKFELVGSERKRLVVVASLHRYVDQLQRRDQPTAA